jgi:large subunit ribosomal protein L2
MLAPQGLKVGDKIEFSDTADIRPGNRLPIRNIPVGTFINDVELIPGQGGKLARSAGSSVLLQTVEAGYGLLKLPSGEIRKVREKQEGL